MSEPLKVQCQTRPTVLYPGLKPCSNEASRYVFGEFYCEECARRLIELNAQKEEPCPKN